MSAKRSKLLVTVVPMTTGLGSVSVTTTWGLVQSAACAGLASTDSGAASTAAEASRARGRGRMGAVLRLSRPYARSSGPAVGVAKNLDRLAHHLVEALVHLPL